MGIRSKWKRFPRMKAKYGGASPAVGVTPPGPHPPPPTPKPRTLASTPPQSVEYAQLRERLASLQHDIWSHWMKHLFSICRPEYEHHEAEIDSAVIPYDYAKRWRRQLSTPYSELSEEEKRSDREQADKLLALLRQYKEDGKVTIPSGG